jgi:hypothetical protein
LIAVGALLADRLANGVARPMFRSPALAGGAFPYLPAANQRRSMAMMMAKSDCPSLEQISTE